MIAGMSPKTADVLFGADPGPELGELTGLVRRIIAALDQAPMPVSMAFIGKELGDDSELFVVPELEWDMPCPEWPAADYTVPAQ